MKKYNADQSQLSESIEIDLEGKTYIIEKITPKMLDDIEALQKTDKGANIAVKQLSILLNAEEETLNKIDLRKIAGILKFIMATITENIEGNKEKNA
jgi:hypothetical protein